MESNQTIKRLDPGHLDRQSRRPAWREHLVLTERGVVRGVRGGSAFFVHFFGCSIVLATGFVLELTLMQWAGVALCITMLLAAEMFNQALKAIVSEQHAWNSQPVTSKATGIATAAVMMTVIGGLATVGLIFAQRLSDLYAQ